MTQTPTFPEPKKPLCVLPFIHAELDPSDRCRPCCAYHYDYGKEWPVHRFEEWWKTGLSELREDMLAGRKNPGCARCWRDEEVGVSSYRQITNANWEKYQYIQEPLERPVFLMLGIGNYCNIKCIMCSPFKSTKWTDEYEKNLDKFKAINFTFDGYPRGFWSEPEKVRPLLASISQDAEMLHFSGGEPLLTPEYRLVLESVANPSETQLNINTNLTVLSETWIELLKKFKTRINLSLEGIGEKNDYIREGSDWTTIEQNYRRLQAAGIDVSISHAFSRTSLYALPELLYWCLDSGIDDINYNWLQWPSCMELQGAPIEDRQQFIDEIYKFVDYRNANYPERTWPVDFPKAWIEQLKILPYDEKKDRDFWKYIDLLDELHDKNFRTIFAITP